MGGLSPPLVDDAGLWQLWPSGFLSTARRGNGSCRTMFVIGAFAGRDYFTRHGGLLPPSWPLKFGEEGEGNRDLDVRHLPILSQLLVGSVDPDRGQLTTDAMLSEVGRCHHAHPPRHPKPKGIQHTKRSHTAEYANQGGQTPALLGLAGLARLSRKTGCARGNDVMAGRKRESVLHRPRSGRNATSLFSRLGGKPGPP